MAKTVASAKTQQAEKNEATVEAEKLLTEMIAEDPRLKVAREQARYASNGGNGIGEETIQIYRQRLRE